MNYEKNKRRHNESLESLSEHCTEYSRATSGAAAAWRSEGNLIFFIFHSRALDEDDEDIRCEVPSLFFRWSGSQFAEEGK